MASIKEKIVGKEALSKILNLLYAYLPFKRKYISGTNNSGVIQTDTNIISNKDEVAFGTYNVTENGIAFSIGIGDSEENRINAIHIKKTGEIHIFNEDSKTISDESLYKIIKKSSHVELVNTYSEISFFNKKENIGKLIYLLNDDNINGEIFYSGLYLIIRCINNGSESTCIKSLITSSQFNADLYYRKTEIDEKINTINNSIEQSNENLSNAISNIESWIDSNKITNNEIDEII
jgi:hypothetical protein